MIGIQLDGDSDFLETTPDVSIDLTLENPLLGDDDGFLSPGSYSLPFDIPAGEESPRNAAKLKNPDVIENNRGYQIQEATLYFNRIPFRRGKLKGKATNRNRIFSYFTFGLNNISPDLKTTRLRDLFNETVVISNAAFHKEMYVKRVASETEAGITINGQHYYADSTDGLGAVINAHFSSHMIVDGDLWLPWSDLQTSGSTPGGLTANYLRIRMARQVTDPITELPVIQYSPDPLIEFHLQVDEIDGEVSDEFQVEVGSLASYYAPFNSFSDSRIVFPVFFNADLHDSSVVKESEIVNAVNGSGLIPNNPNAGHLIVSNRNSLQPFVLLKYVLDEIATHFGFEYEGDFYDEADLDNMLIDNSQALDVPMALVGDSKFIFWRRSFNLAELLPDLTIIEFFKRLKSRYNIAVYPSEITGKVRLVKRETIARSIAYDDITPYCSPILESEDLRVTGIKLFQAKEESDAFSVDESLTTGENPEKTIEIGIGRFHRTKSVVFEGGVVEGVYVSRRMGETFGFRIFYYKGMINNGTYSYPASGISGSEIVESLTAFGGSLYTRFWQYWLLFERNRRLVRVDAGFHFALVRKFNFERKRRFNRVNYLVKSIRFKLTNFGMSNSEVHLYTMK